MHVFIVLDSNGWTDRPTILTMVTVNEDEISSTRAKLLDLVDQLEGAYMKEGDTDTVSQALDYLDGLVHSDENEEL